MGELKNAKKKGNGWWNKVPEEAKSETIERITLGNKNGCYFLLKEMVVWMGGRNYQGLHEKVKEG